MKGAYIIRPKFLPIFCIPQSEETRLGLQAILSTRRKIIQKNYLQYSEDGTIAEAGNEAGSGK